MHRSGERRSDVSPATCSTSRSSRAAALGVTGRRARRPSVRSSSGSSVTSSSAKEPDELLTLFRDLIERVFTGKLDLYNGEKVVVVSDAIDGVRGDEATVKTQVGASQGAIPDRKSTRLNSSHSQISYAVFCLKKKKKTKNQESYE